MLFHHEASSSFRISAPLDFICGKEIRLPLIDSLRLDWQIPAGTELRNFYVEKGADTPSEHGVHMEPIADGYRWIGRSSTYAHPIEGEGREIIPVEIVYSTASPVPGCRFKSGDRKSS
jgi:hypothetical protein